MQKLYALLPCYNEEKNIGSLARKWEKLRKPLLEKQQLFLHIVFIDDGSTDNTKIVIDKITQNIKSGAVLERSQNAGLGRVVKAGLLYFYENGKRGDYAVIMDGDNSHNPNLVMKMIAASKKNKVNCVIASRFRYGSEVKGVSYFRKILSIGARFFYSILLHVPFVRDYTCGYRLYTYESVRNLIDHKKEKFVTQKSFACMTELLYNLYLSGSSFCEVPMKLRYDLKKGSSKMKILSTIYNSIKTAFTLRFNHKTV